MLGRELEVSVGRKTVRAFVLDPYIRQLDTAIREGEIVLPRERFACVCRLDAGGPLSVHIGVEIAFELVVEDHARYACPTVLKMPPLGLEEAIELRVVRQLTRFHEAGVVLLRVAIRIWLSVGLEHVLAGAGQDQDVLGRVVNDNSAGFEQALLRKPADVWRRRLEITFGDHSESSDGGEEFSLRIAEANAVAAKAYLLPVPPPGQRETCGSRPAFIRCARRCGAFGCVAEGSVWSGARVTRPVAFGVVATAAGHCYASLERRSERSCAIVSAVRSCWSTCASFRPVSFRKSRRLIA